MLKLGREIKSPLTEILVYQFDFANLTWPSNPDKVMFQMSKEPIGTGRFRQAFKATTQTHGGWLPRGFFPEAQARKY